MSLLCADFKRAAENREMVRLKLNISGYLEIEDLVRRWPHKLLLPDRLIGHIPTLGKHDNMSGMHEIA